MNYTCPYCGHHSTITLPNRDSHWRHINIASDLIDGDVNLGLSYAAIACPNSDCKKIRLQVYLTEANTRYDWEEGACLNTWRLLPDSHAKPQPSYIPAPIVQDYTEACRILGLSPKSSATLARRCLQGMIRDYWGIRKNRLFDEISELQGKVTQSIWESIDAVRSVGNIGAHMEKDVNTIVDIDPEEADLLIKLIEELFEDWYVERHDREERHAKLKQLAVSKQAEKK